MALHSTHIAENYANALLRAVGLPARVQIDDETHPALRAAQSGLMALTGRADGPPLLCPVPLASIADGVIAALKTLGTNSALNQLDGAALLGERAAIAGLTRAGNISCGGSCRLLRAANGWIAVNLARAYDWEVLPAWLNIAATAEWEIVSAAIAKYNIDELIERGRLLGLAVSAMDAQLTAVPWFSTKQIVDKRNPKKNTQPLVIDLSSLWAGPLCTHLLQLLGARLIKVESTQRPDGAREGPADFYHLLNADKESVALDFSSTTGREQLRQLLLRADIVIEASRPRALRQMDIVAEEIIAANPALTWLSITGYGRDDPQANWVAFGDDAGVAARLSQILFDVAGAPLFCGDAIADPLTGMHAALAAWASFLQGGGQLIALALRDVVAHCIQFGESKTTSMQTHYVEQSAEWNTAIERAGVVPQLPIARKPKAIAHAFGADTQSVLAEFDIPC